MSCVCRAARSRSSLVACVLDVLSLSWLSPRVARERWFSRRGLGRYGAEYSRDDGFFDVSHNLEYFGDDEFMVFANNLTLRGGAPRSAERGAADNGANRSAMVIMKMERGDPSAPANASLSIVWWHEVPYAAIYGDNDRLPSGNLLGVHWPETLDTPPGHTSYESRMVEVVRDTHEIAWEATVFGHFPCESYPCDRDEEHGFDQPQGWAQYQVERFYDAPLVAGASCAAGEPTDAAAAAAASLELSFTAWNQFKQDNPVRAAATPSSLARRARSPPPSLREYRISDVVVRGEVRGGEGGGARRSCHRRVLVQSAFGRLPTLTTASHRRVTCPRQYPGTFKVTSASGAESTSEFHFPAHWRPAKVTATLDGAFSGGDVITLVVVNIWGVASEPLTIACR